MKLYKFSLILLSAGFMLTTSCNDINEQEPEGGTLTKEQLQSTYDAVPERAEADFNGMFSMMGRPHACWPTGANSNRADDFGFISSAFSNDLEGADICMVNSNYNWFSTCSEYSTRNANYANPYMRYRMPYNQIGIANQVIASYPEDTQDSLQVNHLAQAHAIRAFDYMCLAPYFQFGIDRAADQPCVPILKEDADYSNNPRATVREVWEYIIKELDYAVDHLEIGVRTSKDRIDKNVALALRARAHLNLGNWDEAAADAKAALEGYTPASISEVSHPAFCNINDHNWIWGINITTELAGIDGAPTASSWIGSFSGDGYASYINPPFINVLLYNKISATDVRKGWWLDENRQSPILEGLEWVNPTTGERATGNEIPGFETDDKTAYIEYTSVKFGQKSGVGSVVDNNDWPLIRAEEMFLIRAEALLRGGNESAARSELEAFVKTYRDPSYNSNERGLSLANEIWFQRRVELWGEGFFVWDAKRLNKHIVRFHGAGTTNFPDDFTFNIEANDPWLNMRFPSTEINNNYGIVDNSGGEIPVAKQNETLLDGVTD